ncbi:MAG: hypothetical protein WC350_04395 [Candidatus Micrarchaeia archaeon]
MRELRKTLIGMPVPPELALAAAKGRKESTIRGYLSILREATIKFPAHDSQIEVMNAAIRWVRKNHALMDDLANTEALVSITYLARLQKTDPVEAGLAIRMLYGTDAKGINVYLSMFKQRLQGAMDMEVALNLDKMVSSKHFGLLCAAMGDTGCLRMAMFWADQALDADTKTPEGRKIADNLADVPTKAVLLSMAYREAVKRLTGELEKLRAEGANGEMVGTHD